MANFSVEEVLAEIKRQAPSFGVNPNIATALFMAENSSDGIRATAKGGAVSPVGARGVMQVMPATARGLQKAGFLPAEWKHDPTNLSSQVMAGLATIKEFGSRAKNPDDPFEIAAGYNGGNAAHKAYLTGGKLPTETQGYLKKVQAALGVSTGKVPELNMTASASTPQTGATTFTQPTGATSRSVSKTTNVTDPAMMAQFTNNVMNVIGEGGTADNAAAAIIAGGEQRQSLMAQLQAAIQAKGAAAGAEAQANAEAEATAAARRARNLIELNLHPDVADNEMLRVGNVINQTDLAMTSLKPEIDERMAVGMFDNPFQWLVNQTILPGLVAKYNGVVGTQNAAVEKFKSLQNVAKAQQDISTSIDADMALAKGVAIKERMAATATQELTVAQVEAEAATARDALTLSQIAATKAQLAGQLVSMNRETETKREGESERDAAARREKEELDTINKHIVAAGGTPLTTLKGLPTKVVEELRSTATSGKFGKDFVESFEFVRNRGNLDVMTAKGGAGVAFWMRGTLSEAGKIVSQQSKEAAKTKAKFDGEAATRAALSTLKNVYEQEAATDMRTASKYNPHKLSYVSIAKDPDLANNPLAIFINTYGPQGKDPRFNTVDEQYLLQRYAFSVSSGKVPMADATKAIVEFYKVATRKQLTATSWNLFGMETPQLGYAVKLPGLGIERTVDLTNPTHVENVLVYKLASDARAKQADYLFGRGSSGSREKRPIQQQKQEAATQTIDNSMEP